MTQSLYIPLSPAETRFTVRGSKFLGWASPVESEAQAHEFLARRSRLHHDATHHCYAWRLLSPATGGEAEGDDYTSEPIERASDAGEPRGTAGQPILGALRDAGLVNCILIVSRWFGGTKLGTGGLARAYARSAQLTIESVQKKAVVASVDFSLECDYDAVGLVEQLAARAGGALISGDYGDRAKLLVRLPIETARRFAIQLQDATSGKVRAYLTRGNEETKK